MAIGLDTLYLLSSLSGAMTRSQVCNFTSYLMPIVTHEAVSSWTPRPAVSDGIIAFVNVNVVPLDSERILAHHTVLVEGGRITELGPMGTTAVPAGAVRVDSRGKYLIPGLTNMHEHGGLHRDNAIDRRFVHVANGVTAIRSPSGGAVRQEAGELEPYYYRSPPRAELYKLANSDSIEVYVAAFLAAGYDFLALPKEAPSPEFGRVTRVIIDSTITAASRVGLPVSTHNHGESFQQMLALGARGSSEHLSGYFDILSGYFDGSRATDEVPASEIQALAEITRRTGAWNTPTLACLEERRSFKKVQVARQIVKALQEAGAGLLLGGDADGIGGRGSPSMIHSELAALVRAGLSPYQALLTGTRNVAQYFGTLDKSGTVAVGKRADLVLLYGNPLKNIQYTREPAGVMLAGRWIDRDKLDRRLLGPPTGRRSQPWVVWEVMSGIDPDFPPISRNEQVAKLEAHSKTFGTLNDSLDVVKASRQGEGASQRLVQLLAAELGAMRALLTSEQHAAFDAAARVWLREQTRQGYQVAVPGVASNP